MAVELVKAGSKIVDNLTDHTLITCAHGDANYEFRYSDGESDRLEQWLPRAQAAVNSSHPRHPDSLSVPW